MVILENASLRVSINPAGAELNQLYHKAHELEYLWKGDPAFWPKHSPVLFPVIGKLIDDTFIYQNQRYTLPKHGFARDKKFKVETTSKEQASFVLKSTEDTLGHYPFNFVLKITYKIEASRLIVKYEIDTSDEVMYFSIGAHPAFSVPITDNTDYNDYYLEFEQEENADRITVQGSYVSGFVPYLNYQKTLPLQKSLFYDDAIILMGLKSKKISIKTHKNSHGIHFSYTDFPYMGLWAAKNAPFICLEPWCGLPDTESHDLKFEEKEGIICLKKGAKFIREWGVECF